MYRKDELSNPRSCTNKALDHEMMFVLLARDPAAHVALRAWIGERLRLGLNARTDHQIIEANNAANEMEDTGLAIYDATHPAQHNPWSDLRGYQFVSEPFSMTDAEKRFDEKEYGE